MKRIPKYLMTNFPISKFLLTGTLLALLISLSPQRTFAAKPGEKTTEFELPAHDGHKYKLSQSLGHWVVLEWFNQECPFVKKHYDSGNMQNLQKEFPEIAGKKVIWYTIISSAAGKAGYLTPDEATKVMKNKNSLAKAFLIDADGKVGHEFEATTTPHMVVINPEGTLAYMGAIDNQPSADPNDIPKSRNYVREILTQAKEGKKIKFGKTKGYGCSVKY